MIRKELRRALSFAALRNRENAEWALLESMKEIYGILLLVAIGAWLFAALFHPAIRPINLFHPLFTTIRSSLSMDMLKKMRAEKRSE